MKRKNIYQILCIVLIFINLVSCEKFSPSSRDAEAVTKFFQKGPKFGVSPDFAIQKQSIVEPTRWDHVITVHGFVNDAEVCQDLVDYLNRSSRSGKDVYRAVQINQ